MPLVKCRLNNKPGWKYGKENKTCYTYEPGNKKSEARAKLLAIKQGIAISRESGEKFES